MDQAARAFADSGEKQRLYDEFPYAASTWDRSRRVKDAGVICEPLGSQPRRQGSVLHRRGRTDKLSQSLPLEGVAPQGIGKPQWDGWAQIWPRSSQWKRNSQAMSYRWHNCST